MSGSGKTLSEFEIISRYFIHDTGAHNAAVELGIGDDCALLSIPAGQRLAVSIDTAIEGRHFPVAAPAADVAYRTVAAAASDLAAMGAKPVAATLALSLPEVNELWLAAFSQGFKQALQDFGLVLMGGDTTKGPLVITVQVHGLVPNDKALLRSAAKVGDAVFVSGYLGDAAAALKVFSGELALESAQSEYLRQRFYRPQPRLALGQALLPIANSAIDISDGLLADLGHIAQRSGMAAEINIEQLPLSPVLSSLPDRLLWQRLALTGGDDYELCFTVPPAQVDLIQTIAEQQNLPLTRIGSVVTGEGVRCLDAQGNVVSLDATGYQHF